MEKYSGLIILSNDLNKEIEYQSMHIREEFLRVFERDEFKIEDSHQVITQAYITSTEVKTIIMAANSYNHFAQNALLKILEEPPNNTRFILIAKNKTSFLPTIRSRLPLEDKRKRTNLRPFELDLRNLSLKSVYDFLKTLEKESDISKEITKEKIQSLLFLIRKNRIFLNEEELKSFDEALNANQNYQKDIYIFLPLLLMVLQKIKTSKILYS
ncbi:hypothetical protein BKH41_00765 [Helicobacter sp. 12S02232-10]|uniref:DNA polymerase III subunit delta' n=1 Tax=Helicobacter sp. 12S02232-10 TaxID=1476197 RepID=UPI000BA646D1|nr:DNA polymerase III subunit delta' [Helicobacter sp. 12S02232-10]PAF49866.1 hypothetical protein BKH41_00765 [Helicobacter sp. 12S02232-10]